MAAALDKASGVPVIDAATAMNPADVMEVLVVADVTDVADAAGPRASRSSGTVPLQGHSGPAQDT